MTTNAEPGKSAWRKRVLSRFGGDFSSSRGRERSQCGDHSSNSFRALSSVASGDASVRCDVGGEAEAARAAVLLRRGIDGLEVLALVGRHAGRREAADLGVRREQPREQRGAAPVQAGEEDEPVPLHSAQA